MAFIGLSSFSGVTVRGSVNRAFVCTPPARTAKWTMDEKGFSGKGFGGGEATRDPEPTELDPNDPKAKQRAIHNAETFAEYKARIEREKAEKNN